jgi:hypothetical protein
MNKLNKDSDDESQTDPDSVLASLSEDLADGIIDGSSDGQSSEYSIDVLEVLDQDPATLPIPNTDKTVAQVKALVVEEKSDTGSNANTDELASEETVISVKVV